MLLSATHAPIYCLGMFIQVQLCDQLNYGTVCNLDGSLNNRAAKFFNISQYKREISCLDGDYNSGLSLYLQSSYLLMKPTKREI